MKLAADLACFTAPLNKCLFCLKILELRLFSYIAMCEKYGIITSVN